MKIGLVGYGKMGKLVEKMAQERGHQVVAILGRRTDPQTITAKMVEEADLYIEFSHPDAVLNHLKQLIALKKNVVVGTTGWEVQLPLVKKMAEANQVGCLYGNNFSTGFNLFLKIVNEAAALINHFDDYDVAGNEAHHLHKADSPSGTAKLLTEALLNNIQRKKSVVYHLGNRKIEEDELHFSSVRCGSIPGSHQVIFDSAEDNITLSHTARNREGFAKGAVAAAEWLQGKTGLYTFKDMIG